MRTLLALALLSFAPALATSSSARPNERSLWNLPLRGGSAADDNKEDSLAKSSFDPGQLDEMMKSFGGGGNGANMPSMAESMEAMSSMMNNPVFQEYMSDPEKLEESRQMILKNPMLKQMMMGMPGMEELLNDKDAWREAMQAAANMYKNLDSNDLMKAISGAMQMPGTLDADTAAANAVLDELDEDD
jgi:hypothetical protein